MGSVATLTLTGLGCQLAGFLFRILLTRMAGAEVLGLYQMLLPVYAVLLSLTSAGLNTGVSNLSARYQAVGNLRAVHQVRGQAVKLFLLLAAGPCLILELCAGPISLLLLGDVRTRLGLRLLVPCLLLTGVENLQKHYFYGAGRVTPAAVTELLEQLLRTALCLACLRLLHPATAEGAAAAAVLGMALCEAVSALTQTALFRICLGPRDRLAGRNQDPGALRRQLGRIALPLGLSALLGNLLSSANALLIPRLLVRGGMDHGQAVSAYGVLFGMTLPMLMIPTAFLSALGLVLTPRLAGRAALGDRAGIRRESSEALEGMHLILLPAFALLAVFGPALARGLYSGGMGGPHWELLTLGVLFSCWHTLFACVLNGLDRQGTSAAIALLCDGLQLGLTLLLIPRRGLEGYVLSFTLTALLGALLSGRAASRASGLRVRIFPGVLAPVLGAGLASAGGGLLETALLRGGLDPFPAAAGGAVFGALLVLSALGAMDVRLPRLLRAGKND